MSITELATTRVEINSAFSLTESAKFMKAKTVAEEFVGVAIIEQQ